MTTNTRLENQAYRSDIDGLRAVAILSVIGYHVSPDRIMGGFIGVDIFFVISGYLISSNIIRGLEAGNFSFLDFYQRRIKRIFPALLLVLVFSYLLGLAVFDRVEDTFNLVTESPFVQLSRQVTAGAAFFSNFIYWRETNYFDETASTQPLLHLWSLAIEEQFYVVWPVLLYLWSRFRGNYLVLAVLIALASFLFNIHTVQTDPTAAFYSPLSRSWELMLGAILACTSQFHTRENSVTAGNSQSTVGLLLVIWGLITISKENAFPGWVALLPTLGSYLLISAGPKAFFNKYFLENRVLVWFGLISYPLYLWHWPALHVYEIHIAPLITTPAGLRLAKLAVIIACVGLSWLTLVLVEKPIRHHARGRQFSAALLGAMVVVGTVSGITPELIPPAPNLPTAQLEIISKLVKVTEFKDLNGMYGDEPCFRHKEMQTAQLFIENNCLDMKFPGRPTVFLFGDSHSASLSLGLRALFKNKPVNFLQVSSGWCVPGLYDGNNAICRNMNELVLDTISKVKPEIVILNAFWAKAALPPFYSGDDYLPFLIQKLVEIKRAGAAHILVVGQIPIWQPSLPIRLSQTYVKNGKPIPLRTRDGVWAESLEMDSRMKNIVWPTNIAYISLKDLLCNEDGCLTMIGPTIERDLIVWDNGHLTPAGVAYVTKGVIEPALTGLLGDGRQ